MSDTENKPDNPRVVERLEAARDAVSTAHRHICGALVRSRDDEQQRVSLLARYQALLAEHDALQAKYDELAVVPANEALVALRSRYTELVQGAAQAKDVICLVRLRRVSQAAGEVAYVAEVAGAEPALHGSGFRTGLALAALTSAIEAGCSEAARRIRRGRRPTGDDLVSPPAGPPDPLQDPLDTYIPAGEE